MVPTGTSQVPTCRWLRIDGVACVLLLFAGTLFGLLLAGVVETGAFAFGEYHASNTSEILIQLRGESARPSINAAGPDHPAWLAFCGVYRRVATALGCPGTTLWLRAAPVMIGVNLALLFIILRRLRFRRADSLGLVALFASLGATINWSVVVETHVLSPTSLLLATLLVIHHPGIGRRERSPRPRDLLAYGVAMALAASVTITNVMLGILAAVPFADFRRGALRKAAIRSGRRLPTVMVSGLIGVGILAIVNVVGWYLWKDPEMRQFLDVLFERRLIPHMVGSWWDSIITLAWVAPPVDAYSGRTDWFRALDRDWSTAPAYASGLLVLLVVLWSLRVADSRAIFIPAFALFGVVLHAIYGKSESFIFSPAYAWATVVAFGIVGRHHLPRCLAVLSFATAAVLLPVNLAIWMRGIARLQEAGLELTPP